MNRIFVLLILWVAAVPAHAETPAILVFGDSISAGYGLPRVEQGWVALLQAKLKSEGYGYEVVNASVSGETTAGGLARLPRALALHHPRSSFSSSAATTACGHCRSTQMRANLVAHDRSGAARAGAKVLLLGMRIPPNYGPQYTEQFSAGLRRPGARQARPAGAVPAGRRRPESRSHAGGRHASRIRRASRAARERLAAPC